MLVVFECGKGCQESGQKYAVVLLSASCGHCERYSSGHTMASVATLAGSDKNHSIFLTACSVWVDTPL